MFAAKVSGKSKSAILKGVGPMLALMFVVVLGASQALAHDDGYHDRWDSRWHYKPDACAQTSQAALTACKNSASSDYWLGIGICDNLSDRQDKQDCLDEAQASLEEDNAMCKEQFQARQDVCGELGGGPYDPPIDEIQWVNPERISAGTANPYFPLVRGYKWVYKTSDEDGVITETNTDEVLMETKDIMGVKCFVVHDIVYDGNDIDPDKIKEDTYDYYAQDFDGNVWYFGEFSLSFEEDLPSMEGSWIYGVDEAKPGIVMFADPSAELGTVYRQEFALGDAEDWAKLKRMNAIVRGLPYADGNCAKNDECVKTEEGTPLEPDVIEYKYYKPGIGTVLEYAPDTGERTELTRFAPGT